MHRKTHIDEFEFGPDDATFGSEAVWAALERGGFARTEAVEPHVEELLPLGCELIEPRAVGRICRREELTAEELDGLPEPIRDADFLLFGLCTAGQAIDERARGLCEAGELIDSMILDAIAMTGLSIIGDRLGHAAFEWAAERGLSASRSFSPGAGASGWPLAYQQFLFAHVPNERLGVRLTPHYLMQPSKSVSFVIGIGEKVKQAKRAFSCEGCDRFDCAYRHIPSDEMVGEKAD